MLGSLHLCNRCNQSRRLVVFHRWWPGSYHNCQHQPKRDWRGRRNIRVPPIIQLKRTNLDSRWGALHALSWLELVSTIIHGADYALCACAGGGGGYVGATGGQSCLPSTDSNTLGPGGRAGPNPSVVPLGFMNCPSSSSSTGSAGQGGRPSPKFSTL